MGYALEYDFEGCITVDVADGVLAIGNRCSDICPIQFYALQLVTCIRGELDNSRCPFVDAKRLRLASNGSTIIRHATITRCCDAQRIGRGRNSLKGHRQCGIGRDIADGISIV